MMWPWRGVSANYLAPQSRGLKVTSPFCTNTSSFVVPGRALYVCILLLSRNACQTSRTLWRASFPRPRSLTNWDELVWTTSDLRRKSAVSRRLKPNADFVTARFLRSRELGYVHNWPQKKKRFLFYDQMHITRAPPIPAESLEVTNRSYL